MSKVVKFIPSELPEGLYQAKVDLYARCQRTYRHVKKGETVSLAKGEANHHWTSLFVESTTDDRTANIVNAVNRLDPDNPSHWTSLGLPQVSVIQSFADDKSVTREDINIVKPGLCRDSSNIEKMKEHKNDLGNFGQGRRNGSKTK